uniref:LOB domain-containing protein 6 n=1 Tax=Anthurium amnicola TaxID=1678845 RepID=A0A1D1YBI8_9ARAE
MMTSSAAAAAAAASTSSSTSSPCAACKCLRRKCQPDCVFAPYFPPDQPQKFVHVHKVFGASNVTKLLNELTPYQREDAVNSLAYEAEMRLRDPVYGCVGVISVLQHQLRQLQVDLTCAKSELSKYQATTATATLAGAGGGVGHGLVNVNINHSMGMGLGREQFFAAAPAREHHQYHHHHQMVMRNYDAEMAARLGGNNGTYDPGLMAAMNMSTGLGALGGQFSKPRAAGGDERQTIGPS